MVPLMVLNVLFDAVLRERSANKCLHKNNFCRFDRAEFVLVLKTIFVQVATSQLYKRKS
jgi:hypothetical protein